ncbi:MULTISPECIES: hypothetical protein [Streptomyces]|nr:MULTISPECIES: hypothetical protein [unclassified Streptomyces]MBK3542173.1 hypothetical protein [Streptomyces sp. MBT60]
MAAAPGQETVRVHQTASGRERSRPGVRIVVDGAALAPFATLTLRIG